MIKKFYIYLTALLLSAVLLPSNSFSQSEVVKLVYAETVRDAHQYHNTTVCIGNVQFEHKNTKMFCDSALFFRTQEVIYAYGRVHINQGDTVNLFCDTLIYNGNNRVSKLQGKVRMRDSKYKLVTDSLDYDGKISTGYYKNHAIITSLDSDLKLTSVKGYYNAYSKAFFFKDSVRVSDEGYNLISDTLEFRTESKSAHFHGPTTIFMDSSEVRCIKGIYYTDEEFIQLWNGAYLIDSTRTLYADSLIYDQITGVGEGFCNVNLFDSTDNAQFLADYLWKSEANDTIILKKNAAIIQYNKSDTLLLMADSIYNYQNSSSDLSTSIALNNVGIINGDLSARCDSAFFSESDSIIKLHKNPIMWSQETQMTGDSILADYYNKEFHKIKLYDNAFICSEKDTSHYDQIKGKFMTAWVDSSRIQKVHIELSAQSNYYTSEDQKDTLDMTVQVITGMNAIECNEIFIHFINSKIENVVFVDQPTAIYYPIDLVPIKDAILKGFNWQIGLKPESIFRE